MGYSDKSPNQNGISGGFSIQISSKKDQLNPAPDHDTHAHHPSSLVKQLLLPSEVTAAPAGGEYGHPAQTASTTTVSKADEAAAAAADHHHHHHHDEDQQVKLGKRLL